MNNDKDIFEDDFNDSFEDVERLLKPLCEFKASKALKQNVMEKARQEIRPSRIVRMWPWLVAACVVGFLIMFLKPPKMVIEQVPKEEQLMAKAETTKAIEEKQAESAPKQKDTNIETPIQPQVESKSSIPHKTRTTTQRLRQKKMEEPIEEPVQMSEETRKELLMARLDAEELQMEEIIPEEAIRQIRQRGERMISMYEQNDK